MAANNYYLKNKFYKKIIRKLKKDKENAFIKEQLRWIGLRYKKENHIMEVFDDNEVRTVRSYLENLHINKIKLFDNEQKELKEFISKDFEQMINKLQGGKNSNKEAGMKILNKLFLVCDIPYMIKSKKETSNKDGKKNKMYWLIETV